MAKLNATDSFHVSGWMRTELGLEGAELVAFALVHQFSQSNAGIYKGGTRYLSAWLGCSDNSARKYLKSLVARGLVKETSGNENGVPFCYYTSRIEGRTSKIEVEVPQNLREGTSKVEDRYLNGSLNKDIKECVKEKAHSPRFVKPSVEEVRAYCQARGNAVDPEEFVDFYESKGWVIGKSPMKSWQAAVRTWEKSKKTPRAAASAYRPKPKTDPLSSAFNTIDEIHRMFHPEESTIADEQ